jgi:hypothetical protein
LAWIELLIDVLIFLDRARSRKAHATNCRKDALNAGVFVFSEGDLLPRAVKNVITECLKCRASG